MPPARRSTRPPNCSGWVIPAARRFPQRLGRGDLNFSFSGLKTAVLTLVRQHVLDAQARADIAAAFQEAMVEVLSAKAFAALEQTGFRRLVVAGGVGANRQLRDRLSAAAATRGIEVFYPELEFCTDNGAMIAFAGAMRLKHAHGHGLSFTVRPRWELAELEAPEIGRASCRERV